MPELGQLCGLGVTLMETHPRHGWYLHVVQLPGVLPCAADRLYLVVRTCITLQDNGHFHIRSTELAVTPPAHSTEKMIHQSVGPSIFLTRVRVYNLNTTSVKAINHVITAQAMISGWRLLLWSSGIGPHIVIFGLYV